MAYEAIINGDKNDTIDPVHRVIIEQESGNQYIYDAKEIRMIVIRGLPEPKDRITE
jgi:hypothetical protein